MLDTEQYLYHDMFSLQERLSENAFGVAVPIDDYINDLLENGVSRYSVKSSYYMTPLNIFPTY